MLDRQYVVFLILDRVVFFRVYGPRLRVWASTACMDLNCVYGPRLCVWTSTACMGLDCVSNPKHPKPKTLYNVQPSRSRTWSMTPPKITNQKHPYSSSILTSLGVKGTLEDNKTTRVANTLILRP